MNYCSCENRIFERFISHTSYATRSQKLGFWATSMTSKFQFVTLYINDWRLLPRIIKYTTFGKVITPHQFSRGTPNNPLFHEAGLNKPKISCTPTCPDFLTLVERDDKSCQRGQSGGKVEGKSKSRSSTPLKLKSWKEWRKKFLTLVERDDKSRYRWQSEGKYEFSLGEGDDKSR